MYSPGPMGEMEITGRVEKRVSELEGLVAALDSAGDGEEAVGLLERSAALLAEVTGLLEGALGRAEGEARDVAGLLEGLDFGPFDRALAEQVEKGDDVVRAP